MRIRLVLFALLSVAVLALTSCGGGGGAAIVNMIHEGDYYSLTGGNVANLSQSEFLRKARFELGAPGNVVDQAFLHDCSPQQFMGTISFESKDRNENITWTGWPVTPDYLKQYLQARFNWEVEEDTEGGVTYFTNDKDQADNKEAYAVVAGGYVSGREDAVKDLLAGKKRLVDSKEFQAARGLVDFAAQTYSIQWDELDNFTAGLKNILAENEATRIETDDDFKDTMDAGNIVGIGRSEYFTSSYRVVFRILFDKDKYAEEFANVLKDNRDELLKKAYQMILPAKVFQPMTEKGRKDLDELEDKLTVTQAGPMVELALQIMWEDIEEMYKD